MKAYFIIFLFFFSFFYSYSQKTINWSSPDSINPLEENIGSFLDQNLEPFLLAAKIAEVDGRYEDAAKNYLYILRSDFKNADLIYKLARCYGYMNKYRQASDFLIRAVNAGFNDLSKIEDDKAFQGINQTYVFRDAIKRIKAYGKDGGETIYVVGSKLYRCNIKFPNDYDPAKSYPLIIGLHGNGGTSDFFIKYGNYFTKQGFIYIAPQAPYIKSKSKVKMSASYSWGIEVKDKELWKRGDHLTDEYIVNVANYIKENYNIKNIYLFGFSQGAAYSYITGIKNPDIFKGIIAVGAYLISTEKSSYLLSEDHIKKGSNLKVMIAHGKNDKLIALKHGKSAKKRLENAGYDVYFYSYNAGHQLTDELFEGVVSWLVKNESEK